MILERILKCPNRSFFLLGPRGTGKSTWLRTALPQATTVNLLSEEAYQRYLADPGMFAGEMRTVSPGSWVVIDEIQRLPSLLNEVHRFIEERQIRFALCGSSARKLRQAGVNLLAGRALRKSMHPFVPAELGEAFVVDEALRWGTLPAVWSSDAKKDTLLAYTQLYLKEEIQAEALVRNLPGFSRFLPVAALFHGQAINVTNIARKTGVARTTVGGYLDILEETLLCFRLPAFEGKLRVRERRHPKLYWADTGIVRAIKKQLGEVTTEERGPLFEGLVAGLLRAYRDYADLCDDLYYWAPTEAADIEVDFLLVRGAEFIAVEVKSGAHFSEGWCRGLRAIREMKGLRRSVVVCPSGPALRTKDGIDVLPFRQFADQIADNALWP